MNDSDAAFLAQVTSAVQAGKRYRQVQRRPISGSAGYIGAGADPVATFCAEAQALGAVVARLTRRQQVEQAIRTVVERHEVSRAVVNASGLIDRLGVVTALRSAGVEVLTVAELSRLEAVQRRDRLFAADLGIAAPDWAVAETGSLVYLSAAGQTRSASLLPPVHVALVEQSHVLPDLFDLFSRLQPRAHAPLADSVVVVTGPSKTADIELRLTTGVHGPGKLHVMVWTEGQEKASL